MPKWPWGKPTKVKATVSPWENAASVINFKDKFYHAKPLLEEMKAVTVCQPVYHHLSDTHFYFQL